MNKRIVLYEIFRQNIAMLHYKSHVFINLND